MKFLRALSYVLVAFHSAFALANTTGTIDASFDNTEHGSIRPVAVLQVRPAELEIVSTSEDGTHTNVFRTDRDGFPIAGTFQTYAVGGTIAATSINGSLVLVGNNPAHVTFIDSNGQVIFNQGAARDKIEFNAVAPLSDGFIVAGSRVGSMGNNKDFYAARYDVNGNAIAEFQYGFDLGALFDDTVQAIAVDHNRVILVGTAQVAKIITTTSGASFANNCAIAVLQLDTFNFDPTWQSVGKSTIDWSGYTIGGPTDSICRAVAVQSDGSVVVGGEAYSVVSGPGNKAYLASEWGVARFGHDGAVDRNFARAGNAIGKYIASGPLALNGVGANSLAIQRDGSIIFAGFASEGAATDGFPFPFIADIAVGKLKPTGTYDFAFGQSLGYTAISHDALSSPPSGGTQYAVGLLLDVHDRPVILGTDIATDDSGTTTVISPLLRLLDDYIFSDRFDRVD
jgi:hypothetical protein